MKNNIYSCTGLALSLVVLVLGACNAGGSRDFRVSPGKGIGQIMLGDSRSQLLERLGQSMQGEAEQVSDTLHREEWPLGEHAMLTALFQDGRVVQLRVTGQMYTAPSGLSGQSTIQEIRTAYPDMIVTVMAHDLDNMYLDDVGAGIAFSVRAGREGEPTNADGDVIDAYVHPPGREVIAIVHHH